MAFCIVQTRKTKKAKPSLTIVPGNWVEDDCVYWPPSNLVSLSKIEQSVPDKQNWKKQNCKLVGRSHTYEQAEEVVGMLDKITDSEDALQMDRGTRTKPAKKRPKFQSKSYQLAPPVSEPVSEINTPGPSANSITDLTASHVKPEPKQMNQPMDISSVSNLQLNSPKTVPNPVTHQFIQPAVTDPMVLHVQAAPNTVEQSNRTGYDCIDKVAMQELPVFMGNDGKHYAKLDNGCFLEITNNQDSTNHPQLDEDVTVESQSNPETAISMEFRKLHDRLDIIDGMLDQMMNFMANVNKLMQMRTKDDTISSTYQQNEDFSEFEGLPRIDTVDSLKALEQSLGNPTFADKYFRYFHTLFSLNGKREGAPFFRTLIRKLVMPGVFLPYSWKGNKCAKKSSSSDTAKHISFEASYPEFIKFVHRVVHAADLSHTREHNEKLFKDYLRYKITEFKRFEQGYGDLRASSTRKRKQSKVPEKSDEEMSGTSSKRQRSSSSRSSNGSKTSLEEV